jgi:hypothetical protein
VPHFLVRHQKKETGTEDLSGPGFDFKNHGLISTTILISSFVLLKKLTQEIRSSVTPV